MIPGLPEGIDTSYCTGCHGEIYLGKYILRGAYEPDYDPNDDPVIWRHANGYHRVASDGHSARPGFPEIVTLCGSTKFRDQFEDEQRRLGLEGCIVITVALFGHQEVEKCKRCGRRRVDILHQTQIAGVAETFEGAHEFEPLFDFGTDDEPSEVKTMLDRLHFRKIDLCHRVHVINPGGYVGASTSREIYYGARHGKELSWMEPMDPGDVAEILRRGERKMYPALTVEAQ